MGSVTSDTHQFDLPPLGELRIVVARYNEELTPWKPVAKCDTCMTRDIISSRTTSFYTQAKVIDFICGAFLAPLVMVLLDRPLTQQP
jgi:hypothetical protein